MGDLPKRKSIRMKDYDYSQSGAYFVTICVKDKHELLGTIVGAIHNRPQMALLEHPQVALSERPQMALSDYGKIVETSINQIPTYSSTYVDKHIIMPNHVHMILLVNAGGEHGRLRADGEHGRLRADGERGRLRIAPTPP